MVWMTLRLMSIQSVMPSSHLILCHPLLFLPSVFPMMSSCSIEFGGLGEKKRWKKKWNWELCLWCQLLGWMWNGFIHQIRQGLFSTSIAEILLDHLVHTGQRTFCGQQLSKNGNGISRASQMALVVTHLPMQRESRDTASSIPGSGRPPGEGSDNPLQCSCVGDALDRGAWRATQSVGLQSRTGLSTHSTSVGNGNIPWMLEPCWE